MTDAESHSTIYTYDDMGRILSTTSSDTGTVTYGYDEAGNPDYKTDANGITVDYSHDFLNRLIGVNFPAHGNLSAYSVTYSYDDSALNGIGNLTEMTDPSGSTFFGYDTSEKGTLLTSRKCEKSEKRDVRK